MKHNTKLRFKENNLLTFTVNKIKVNLNQLLCLIK